MPDSLPETVEGQPYTFPSSVPPGWLLMAYQRELALEQRRREEERRGARG